MHIIKYILFLCIISLLVALALSREIIDSYEIEPPPLHGYAIPVEEPAFSWDSWFNGEFQNGYNDFIKENLGFRNYAIKALNQADFTLFQKSHAEGVIVGKDDYLYELNYILAYAGKDFIGKDVIQQKSKKLKHIQDELNKMGKELLVVLAPGKASYFSEYIPGNYLKRSRDITNNTAYARCFDSLGVNYIDFNALFKELKETSEYALFPKCGIHWTAYGSWLALDTILCRLEHNTGMDLVDISYEGIEVSNTPRLTDYDIADGMNLLDSITCNPMPYPFGQKCAETGKIKPRLMVIADSYYWSIYNKRYNRFLWSEQDFRYYNQQTFSPGKEDHPSVEVTIDMINNFDIIMLMYTEANMKYFANNFIDQAYQSLVFDKRLSDIRQRILNTPEWVEDIKVKALEKGVSLETMINLDAKWVLDHELAKEGINPDNN